ncbi:hypothetical protein PF005_g25512 [Phytophthora fragariae]|uniref:DDE Tnp4 domain-containing protein n=1 Tax=Phytophthora fragariae TaxID=53985 RepID=A0A6A3DYD0_9STRA|nr:hypothetical protein PF009_g26212 [Phytophthora fragariae]KAE8975852.1 hypothetical protein PF011_g24301 [Phytophthora fragariae]KAE9074090.1 hypothetical protein PF007_g25553 [Phytophthora fragariae]KAE9091839.1 hypothetical protein PF006_g24836 [Phytophthora fragariae]KAE9175188.1 hypothetical protein PF005_g25512 [Phytophthora fragariae]
MVEEYALESTAIVLSVLAVVVCDKRNWPEEKKNLLAVRTSAWSIIRTQEAFSVGWFGRQLRCTRTAFEEICRRVSRRWTTLLPPLGANTEYRRGGSQLLKWTKLSKPPDN